MTNADNQVDLFGDAPAGGREKKLEIHEHCIVSGPRHSNVVGGNRIVHSHDGGDTYHRHPDTGPASFVIDKDEWLRETGMRGGGRKKFTTAPEGEQLERIAPEPGEGEFEIHVGSPPPGWTGTGAGLAPAYRMILGARMTVSNVVPFTPRRKKGAA
jgi:hypothetical protein